MNIRYYAVVSFLTVAMWGLTSIPAQAQFNDISSILQSGKEDANLLANSYLKPFGSGFGASLNTGWTNTAKPHGKLGFDVTVSTGLAVVPQADKSFDVTQIGLTQLEYENGPATSPTLHGENATGSTLAAYAEVEGQREKLFEFTMPEGTGFGYVPAPVIKAGIGVIKDTELMLRYMPEADMQDWGTASMFGAGVKHGINQWIPGGKLLPVDLAIMAGFTEMNISSDFDVRPEDVIENPENTENPYADAPSTWNGQGINIDTNAWTVNALVGKTLPIISVYGGVGYEVSTLNVATPGAYPTVIPNEAFQDDPNNNDPFVVDRVDQPIDFDLDGENSFRALAGFRMKFAIFHISGSYTLANYSSYNLGFGISFR